MSREMDEEKFWNDLNKVSKHIGYGFLLWLPGIIVTLIFLEFGNPKPEPGLGTMGHLGGFLLLSFVASLFAWTGILSIWLMIIVGIGAYKRYTVPVEDDEDE